MNDTVPASPSDTTSWSRMDSAQLAAALAQREQLKRRLQAEQDEILAEMQSRGTHAEYGYGSLEALQVDVLHISRGEAKRRASRALCLNATHGLGGTPALAPVTAAAAHGGEIGTEHVDEILKTLVEIPGEVPEDEREGYENILVDLARESDPMTLRKACLHLLQRINTDGSAPPDEELAEPQRELRYQWKRDGRFAFTGALDAETGKLFEALLSPVSKPRPAENGERDVRTAAERRGDGLAELLRLLQNSEDRPYEGGERVSVVVTLSYEELRDRLAGTMPRLNDLPITAEQARRLACDADIIPAVLGSRGEILNLGRSQRLASTAQRRALALRDKGCVKCGRPPKWCHAHHIIHWLDGGLTDLDNLCLLCSECHRLIHHSDWEIVMGKDGHPRCIPPKWIDPAQRPRTAIRC